MNTRWREKMNVLVMEADRQVFESIRQTLLFRRAAPLDSPRFTVEHATNVETALERLRRDGVDGIIVGINRGDSSGLHGIARLSETFPLVPIVALLDSSDERLAVAAFYRLLKFDNLFSRLPLGATLVVRAKKRRSQ